MKPGMILYREELGMMLLLDDNELAEAMKLLIKRFMFDEEPETDNTKVDYLLRVAIPKQEADEEGYKAKVEGASKGGKATQGKAKHTSSIPSESLKENQAYLNKQEQEQEQEHKQEQEQVGNRAQKRAFRPPTVQEVAAYCEERGNGISAERFIDHYSANGWKVGKNSMKDWKAAVRNWEKNEFRTQKPEPEMQSHEWNYDELEKLAFRRALGG